MRDYTQVPLRSVDIAMEFKLESVGVPSPKLLMVKKHASRYKQ